MGIYKRFNVKCKCPNCNHSFYANTNKVKLIELIKEKDMMIAEICKGLGLSRAAVYHHIEALRSEGLIIEYNVRGRGRSHYIKWETK